MQYWVIIPAAGSGARMQAAVPKQYLQLQSKTILEHTLNIFLHHPKIEKIFLVVDEHATQWHSLEKSYAGKTIFVPGGSTRAQSVMNGLIKLQTYANAHDWVLVHDAVRPCLQQSDLDNLIGRLQVHPIGGLLVTPAKDTLKKLNSDNSLTTLERKNIWHALTPQMFRFTKLFNALQSAIKNNHQVTDESQAIELSGESPVLVEGHADNIKITNPEDLFLAETILNRRMCQQSAAHQ